MVLDEGNLVVFDSPAVLISKESSYVKKMVDESMEKEKLLELAGLWVEYELSFRHFSYWCLHRKPLANLLVYLFDTRSHWHETEAVSDIVCCYVGRVWGCSPLHQAGLVSRLLGVTV